MELHRTTPTTQLWSTGLPDTSRGQHCPPGLQQPRLPERNLTSVPPVWARLTRAFETCGSRKVEAGGVSYQHSQPTGPCKAAGKGSGPLSITSPRCRGQRHSGGRHWTPRPGHRLLEATQRAGDRAGSKCPELFLSCLLKNPKFLPERSHLPPRALPSALPAPLLSLRQKPQ